MVICVGMDMVRSRLLLISMFGTSRMQPLIFDKSGFYMILLRIDLLLDMWSFLLAVKNGAKNTRTEVFN